MITNGTFPAPKFSKWHAAAAGVRSSTANARILCIGDSTTWGVGASPITNYPYRLASFLNSHLLPTSYGTTFGRDVSWPDTRVTLGSGWAGTAFLPFGAKGFAGTVAGGTLSFTPTESFDTIKIYHVQGPIVGGISTINVDGGASLGNIVGTGGTNVMTTTTFSCSAGTHTINIASPTVDVNWIVGIETSSTTTRQVLVGNAGHSLTTTTDWSQNPSSIIGAKASIDIYQPHLTVVNLSINDSSVSTSPATVKANIEAIIGYCQPYGDVILVNPTPCGVAPNTTYQPLYTPVISDLAAKYGCGFVDLASRWVNWTTANGLGLFYDDYHPSDKGYADVAAAIYSYLHYIT